MSYQIRKKFHHKGYVFLLSITPLAAFWSAHKFDGDHKQFSIYDAARMYQGDHDNQIEGLIAESIRDEPDEFKENSIHDITRKQ